MFDTLRIAILLGTYNGVRFVGEQLRSIQDQTVSSWTLLVRDDGSQDGTLGLQRQGVLRQLLLYWRLLVSSRGTVTD